MQRHKGPEDETLKSLTMYLHKQRFFSHIVKQLELFLCLVLAGGKPEKILSPRKEERIAITIDFKEYLDPHFPPQREGVDYQCYV